ncbi:MAG: hypothetical protein IPF55_08785 [Rhodoferax sp.]|nr:hypothetical protein [Rhodoferax sp.]
MGWYMKEDDIYIGSLLDEMNVRFAPSQGKEDLFGGIDEMVALQKEFKIFKKGRSFKTSLSVLNIGARGNLLRTDGSLFWATSSSSPPTRDRRTAT